MTLERKVASLFQMDDDTWKRHANLEIWPTLFGAVTIYLGKLWFVDRMVWLYHDMKDANQEYSSW